MVEDDLPDVVLISSALNKSDPLIRVQVVRSGEDAVHYLKGEAKFADRKKYPVPDLVILDLGLPMFDGFDFLGWLRAEPSVICRIPVVVLTGSDREEDIDRAYSLGANALIAKPKNGSNYPLCLEAISAFWSRHNELPPEPGPKLG